MISPRLIFEWYIISAREVEHGYERINVSDCTFIAFRSHENDSVMKMTKRKKNIWCFNNAMIVTNFNINNFTAISRRDRQEINFLN